MAHTEQATRYREIRRLGTGGMATVTLAEDTVLGRLVALKRVYGAGDARAMLRLKREALVGASLNHSNIVFVYDAKLQDDGDVVIVMEYVEGNTLADKTGARRPLAPSEVMRVLRGVAAALDAIHERGIVHRDVKPANVLLGDDGAVKLADLGVAHMADRTRITSQNAVVGSFSYMAPEQLDGARPTPAMDIYALAAVAYEMLTGERARPESNPLTLAHAIATQPPPDLTQALPDAPAAAAAVLQRAMSATPSERPRSATELVRRLESAYAPERPTQDLASRSRPRPVVPPAPVPVPVASAPAAPSPAAAAPSPRKPTSDRRARPIPPPTRKPQPPAAGRRRRSMLVPGLLALAALAVLAVVIASLGDGGKKRASASTPTPRTTAAPPAAATPSRSAKSTAGTKSQRAGTTSSSTPASGSSGQPSSSSTSSRTAPAAGAGTAPSSGGSSSATASGAAAPAGAVEQFYEAAASHQYSTAWALADANLQSQIRGYSSFQNTFSAVRSITFHSAQVLPGSGGDAATVAVRTTSVQTGQTQQCAGMVRTVRSGGTWLLDHISISCS